MVQKYNIFLINKKKRAGYHKPIYNTIKVKPVIDLFTGNYLFIKFQKPRYMPAQRNYWPVYLNAF